VNILGIRFVVLYIFLTHTCQSPKLFLKKHTVIAPTLNVVFKPRFGLPLLCRLPFVGVASLENNGGQWEWKCHCLVAKCTNKVSYHSTERQICLKLNGYGYR